MGKRLLLGLILVLVLSAGAFHAQDSSDDSGTSDTSGTSGTSGTSDTSDTSGTSDTSDTSDAAAFSPAPPSAIDANTAIDSTDATTVDFATQQAIDAVTTPWGGVPAPVALGTGIQIGPGGNPVRGVPGEPGTFSPGLQTPPPEPVPPIGGIRPSRRAQIHAVIVSNLSDPSQVLSGNVNLTGGIVALGPPTSSQKPGRWDPNVLITPDPDLLNGSKIPPLVPNVIDVRITHYEVSATIESQGSVSSQP